MSFSAQEDSVEGAQPVELFLFTIAGVEYPYTNSEDAITQLSVDYVPEAIQRGKIQNEADKSTAQLDITVPVSNPFVKLFIGIPPGERAKVKIFQYHRTDVSEELVTIFDGVVAQVGFIKKGKVSKILCKPITSVGSRQMPKSTFQGLCNRNLYDDRCQLLETDWEEFGTIVSSSGRDATVSGITNIGGGSDYWEAGFVEFGNERRLVNVQTTDVLTLNIEFKEDPTGAAARFVPGCKLTRISACRGKFGNEINYGGFPYVPLKNPFEAGID